jgi:predicted MFS family arabinose efflux permease
LQGIRRQAKEVAQGPAAMASARRRLPIVIIANALLRIAGGASGILVGLYLSAAANRGMPVDAALVGVLGAVSFGAELLASLPMGMLSDALATRGLMTAGALLGAAATQLFGITGRTGIFFLSRTLEGLGIAANGPALLSHLTDTTNGFPALRVRAMSFYELSFLVGLAAGGVTGSQLWRMLNTSAFGAVAAVYVLGAALLAFGAAGSKGYGGAAAWSGFCRALREPYLRRLAPIWLCVNTIVGLWLGPTLTFLMTQRTHSSQFLAGIFADEPQRIGRMLLGYSVVFGAGLTAWSVVLPRLGETRVLRIGLIAMPVVCVGLFLLNHSANSSDAMRWSIGAVTALCIMIESGFTPAALSLLAGAVGASAGRGAAMGIYSVLLSIGAIAGSLLAAGLGERFSVDGLIYGTFGLALVALALVRNLESRGEPHEGV